MLSLYILSQLKTLSGFYFEGFDRMCEGLLWQSCLRGLVRVSVRWSSASGSAVQTADELSSDGLTSETDVGFWSRARNRNFYFPLTVPVWSRCGPGVECHCRVLNPRFRALVLGCCVEPEKEPGRPGISRPVPVTVFGAKRNPQTGLKCRG